jgi:ketosteroid isomerase-like protein
VSDSVKANLALSRRLYEDWNADGLEGLMPFLAHDMVFYETPDNPETGVFRGVEEFAAHVRQLVEGAGHFHMNPISLEGRGDYVFSLFEVSFVGRSSGAPVASNYSHLLRWAGDRVVELRTYSGRERDRAVADYERLSSPPG